MRLSDLEAVLNEVQSTHRIGLTSAVQSLRDHIKQRRKLSASRRLEASKKWMRLHAERLAEAQKVLNELS